jgi:hypothetical protein
MELGRIYERTCFEKKKKRIRTKIKNKRKVGLETNSTTT